MYRTVKKIADVCGLGAGYSAGVILALMGTVITFEVIARRAGHPTIWSFEFTKYFFLWSMLIGAAYTQQQDANLPGIAGHRGRHGVYIHCALDRIKLYN